MIKQLTLIGLGLIGASIARAIKSSDFCQTIVGYDADPQTLQKALELKIIDSSSAPDISVAVKNADFIVIAVPVGAFTNVLQTIKPFLKNDAIITDVSSVKSIIVSEAERILGNQIKYFVPGHPIAGSEKTGIEAAKADLFSDRLIILTPSKITAATAIEKTKLFWENMGAKIKILDADMHDALLANTSHLPQTLAYLFMHQIATDPHYPEILQYAGGGFKDFSRIAASNPALWSDILLANKSHVLPEIRKFQQQLLTLQQALENTDITSLLKIFSIAQQARKKIE